MKRSRTAKYRGSTIGRYARGAMAVARGLGRGYRFYRSHTANRSSGHREMSATNQYDAKNVYRKRSKRVSKRVKAFRRKVSNISMGMNGSNQFIFQSTTSGLTVINQQDALSTGLLGNGFAPNNDYTTIRDNIQTSGQVGKFRQNETIYIRSQCIDITISPTTAGVTADIDLYVLMCRRNTTQGPSVSGMWNNWLGTMQKPDGSGATTTSIVTLGCTPFQAPQFCSTFTVLSKKKYLLTQGQTAHFQHRVARPKWLNLGITQEAYFIKGTVHFLIVWNGVCQNGADFPASSLSVGYVRTYDVKYSSTGDDRTYP